MSRGRRSQGAAMLAVLVISAVFSVLLSYATSQINARLTLAEDSLLKTEDLAKVSAKLNELLYLVATQRITAAGISRGVDASGLLREDGQWLSLLTGDEIRADGFVYEAEGIQFSIQNQSGLIPINTKNQYWLDQWLSRHDYDFAARRRLTEVLADHLDADNASRPFGREMAASYPGNFLAQTCGELARLPEWYDVIRVQPKFLASCSLSRSATLNINAVPDWLWQHFWPRSVAQLRAARGRGDWILRDSEVLKLLPDLLVIPEELYTRRGGNIFILRVRGGFSALAVRAAVVSNKVLSFKSVRLQE